MGLTKNKIILKFSALNRINAGDIVISRCIEEIFKKNGIEIISFDLLLRENADINNRKNGENNSFRKKALNFIKKFPSLYHAVYVFYYNVYIWKKMQNLIDKYDDSPIMIGGGNLLFNKGGSPFLYVISKIIRKYHVSRKIFLVSIGAGPFSLKWEKRLRQIVKNAEYVSVRDFGSLDIIRSVNSNVPVQIIPDPVFLLEDIFLNRNGRKEQISKGSFYGINIMEFKGKGQVTDKIAENLNIISRITDKKAVIINTSFASDHIYSAKIAGMLKDKYGVDIDIENILSEEDVPGLYEKMDFIICSRMHSAIFAVSFRIPFFIYPWDPKITNFVKTVFGSEFAEKIILKDINYSSDEILNKISNFPLMEYEKKIDDIKKIVAESFGQLMFKIR